MFLFFLSLQQNHFSFGGLPHLAPMAASTTDSPAPEQKQAGGGKGDHKHKHHKPGAYEKSDSKHFSDHHLPDISKFPDRFWDLTGQGVWTPVVGTPALSNSVGEPCVAARIAAAATSSTPGAASPGVDSHLPWPQKQLRVKLDAIKTDKSIAAGNNLSKPRKFSVDTTPLPKLESSSSFVFKWLHKK